MSLQMHYANMLQLKLQTTGVRGRKRGKNPLMMFIENIRRNKDKNNYIYKIKTEEDACELFFSAFKIRVALLKGLKTKKLVPEVLESIDNVLDIEDAKASMSSKNSYQSFSHATLKKKQ